MGQQDVYEFLKKNKRKWMCVREIAGKMNGSLGSVTNNLKKLRESKRIHFRMSKAKVGHVKRKIYEYMFMK